MPLSSKIEIEQARYAPNWVPELFTLTVRKLVVGIVILLFSPGNIIFDTHQLVG